MQLLAKDATQFKELVRSSLRRQVNAINFLADKGELYYRNILKSGNKFKCSNLFYSKIGMFFWDYGNAFLLEAQRAGAEVSAKDDPTGLKFRYPSYVIEKL